MPPGVQVRNLTFEFTVDDAGDGMVFSSSTVEDEREAGPDLRPELRQPAEPQQGHLFEAGVSEPPKRRTKPADNRTLRQCFDTLLLDRIRTTCSPGQQGKYRTAADLWDQFTELIRTAEAVQGINPKTLEKLRHRCWTPVAQWVSAESIEAWSLWRFASEVVSVSTVYGQVQKILRITRQVTDKPPEFPDRSTFVRWRNHALQDRPRATTPAGSKIVAESQVHQIRRGLRSPEAAGLFQFLTKYFGDVIDGRAVVDYLICLHLDIGSRTLDLFPYMWRERPKLGLRWHDVHFGTECPDADCRNVLGSAADCANGFLYYLVSKDVLSETESERRVLYPMAGWMRRFFEIMRTVPRPLKPLGCPARRDAVDEMVFPMPVCQKRFGPDWRKLLKLSGVPDNIRLSEGQGRVAAIRKTCANRWVQITGRKDIGQHMLHHADVTTLERHYLSQTALFLPELLQHHDRLDYGGMVPGTI